MLPSLARVAAVAGLLSLASACTRASEEQRAKAQLEGRNPKGTSAHSLDDRIPAFEGEPIGVRSGYVEGAFVYASARAGAIGALWQALSTGQSERTAVEGLVALLDGDPAVHALLEPFGVDPRARMSTSLRSIGPAAELRGALEAKAPPSRELFARAASIGVHLRVHIPVLDRPRFEASVAPLAEDLFEPGSWAETCAAIGPSLTCGGDHSSFAIVRPVADGYVADLILTGHAEPDDPVQRPLIEAAVALPGGQAPPEVFDLRGDAAVLLDAPGLIDALRGELVRDMAFALEHGSARAFERERETHDLLDRLHTTDRLFEGVTVELALTPARSFARGRWLIRDGARERLRSVFELDPVDADVPTIAALCDGALMCGRTRGLPAQRRFAGLATGLYADLEALASVFDEDETELVLLLETWPNAIGTLVGPPETMLLQNAAEVGARVLGFGFAIRSQRSRDEGRVAYARMSAADVDSLRRFMQLSGSSFSSVAIAGVDGRVESIRTPTNELPDRIYAVYDPGQWGWTVAADDDEQVAWLASLAHDDGAVPMVYFEIPDLGQLITSDPALERDYGIWAAKLAKRGLRAQVTLTPDWVPEVRVAIGKRLKPAE